MNRLAGLIFGLIFLGLSACAPQAQVEHNVVPTLFSTTATEDTVVLQGRNFDDGVGGEADNSYVILGANVHGNGGVIAPVVSWSNSRIEVGVPSGAGYGHAFVFVNGVRSNGLPTNPN